MQIERTDQIKRGPTYRIKIGNNYSINRNYILLDSKNQTVKLCEFDFDEYLFDKKKRISKTYKKDIPELSWVKEIRHSGISLKSFDKLKTLSIKNLSKLEINVRICDYLTLIKSKSERQFKIKQGRHKVEIIKNLNSEDIKDNRLIFLLNACESYTFNEYDEIVQNNNGRKVLEYSAFTESICKKLMDINVQKEDNQDNRNDILIISVQNQDDQDCNNLFCFNKFFILDDTEISDTTNYFRNQNPNYIKGKEYIDQYFPPNEFSLNGLDEIPESQVYYKPHFTHFEKTFYDTTYVKFIPPSKIFKGKPYFLFKDSISANDVIQSENIHNCYLMSILSAMALRPELILDIFKSEKVNRDGFYQLYYYNREGEKKIIFVDHYFPYELDRTGKRQSFASNPNGEEIWVSLIEKAYAKYEGGYSKINGGTIIDELFWLTGSICQTISLNDIYAWDNLKIASKKNYIICCRSKSSKDQYESQNQIVFSHAYSILNANEYKNIRLLTLRNPYGQYEWNADYSDKSNKWNLELKEYFHFSIAKGENGIFFISFEDFIQEFTDVIICFC